MTTTSLIIDSDHQAPLPPTEMETHQLATIFPMLPASELADLAVDMRTHGFRKQFPIITLDGKILDGRNRHKASQIAGVEPITEEYVGDDPASFVASANLMRRHLSESQRSMAADKLAGLPKGLRSDRQDAQACASITQDEAAAMLGVSRRKVQKAAKVRTVGTPELASAVESGEITLNAAEELAKLPAARQLEVLTEGPDAVREKAKEIRDFGGEIAPSSRTPAPAEEWSAESQAAAEEAAKDSEKLWLLKSTWRKASKKDRALFMEWAPPPTTPPPACRDDPWDLWNDAKAYLDRACRIDKTITCGRMLIYAKKKMGREFRTHEGVGIAAEVVAHLDLITKDDEDFLEAMARVIEYCGGRIGDRRLNADGLASITTSPDFARMMEYTCYRLMAMIRPENPKARYALEMIESQCRRHLDALPPETGDATTETPEEVDGGAGE